VVKIKCENDCDKTVHACMTAHFHIFVINLLELALKYLWIDHHNPVTCWSRFPDLTPLDLFLWGLMKEICGHSGRAV
jgi:hypothetical protein